MVAVKEMQLENKYLDIQAAVGITKHNGGFAATDELLALCHIEQAKEVLYVGSGIGVGPTYIAKKHGCHVVGVDISEKMIQWSQQRAKEEQVTDKVEFRVANVLELPFETDRFDVVVCESVLAFLEDKEKAIQECIRVTKPGGYVGLNESFWIKEPPAEIIVQVRQQVAGTDLLSIENWQALWEASQLQDRVIRNCEIEARTEIKSRIQWVGWRWMLRAWGRALRLYLTDPAARQAFKEQLGMSKDVFQHFGYGLFVGRK